MVRKYFEKTPRELAALYLENPENLGKDMKERLVHEADFKIMKIVRQIGDQRVVNTRCKDFIPWSFVIMPVN